MLKSENLFLMDRTKNFIVNILNFTHKLKHKITTTYIQFNFGFLYNYKSSTLKKKKLKNEDENMFDEFDDLILFSINLFNF